MLEKKAKEQAEEQRLLASKKEIFSKNRKGWKITVFQLPESNTTFSKKFLAECTKDKELLQTVWFYNTQGDAYSQACNLADNFEMQQEKFLIFLEHYTVMKPLYLMIIYLSGGDQHNCYLKTHQESKENFTGISFWNGFDFEIINALVAEGLLELSNSRKTLIMNKTGMKLARDLLQKINLDGVDRLLEQRDYHEEYINHISELDMMEYEEEEEQ
ncbi:hypothetical protein I8748_13170 [Nostoc sp. CENA67]|uniref:Uncharacterized protein n=1 Tax=Amazonocrinis nigriterrae CENA67 TaxID=2794033 RepID=A0A8J7HP94_9NOST|nr:DUF6429 family protein [Amazonocrinis nigriterrae]MBH8563122.1 hypothetical protein [Amazonocrinis nigriterrae CENA67]